MAGDPNCLFTPENCEGLQRLEGKIDDILTAQKAFSGAFAEDRSGSADLSGHRAYHEGVIAAVRAQEAFWRDMRYDLTRKGIWAIFLALLGLIVTGAAYKLITFMAKLGLAVPGK